MNSIEITGKTIEDAVRSGLARLGLLRNEVDIEVLAEPKSGFLGFGSKPAKVRLTAKSDKTVAAPVVEEPLATAEPAAPAVSEAAPVVPAQEDAETTEQSVPEFSADEAAAKAKDFLQDVLHNMGITDVLIEKMNKGDKIILHLHGSNLGILIGKHGQTLDALQYLTNLTTNQGEASRHFIMLDVENYRHRREETLKQLALRLSGRVKRQGDRVVLEPMNGYERKVIHVALQNKEHIATESEGQDPYRHVVIYYKD